MAYNKFIYNGDVKFDLTADTVTADKILVNYTAHDASGTAITGTCDYDVNSQDATVSVAEILDTKTAYARGVKLTGTMPNNGAVSLTISNKNAVTIPQGYHDGSGTVGILSTELAKIIAGNIKKGVSILGVTGSLEPSSSIKVQSSQTVTPSFTSQTITPSTGYDYLAQVVVNAIPYTETQNSAGGTTITIG